jgi:hypothetical protein
MAILSYSAGISRDEFITEIKAHRAADRLVAGEYWSGYSGCAVGCGVETINRRRDVAIRHNDHAGLAAALGWPEWLIHLEDKVFESLPAGNRVNWPVNLAVAVPEGVDLEPALNSILARILREIVLPVAGESAGIVERVATGCATGWANDCPEAEAAAAEATAAWAVARAIGSSVARAEAAWAVARAIGSSVARAEAARAAARAAADAAADAAAWAVVARAEAWRKIAAIVLEEVARCS